MRNSQHSVSLGTFGLAFAIVLSPALMRDSCPYGVCIGGGPSFTCEKTGDTTLSALEFEVSGVNQITFSPGERSYDVWLPASVGTATVRAQSTDPAAQLTYNFGDADGFIEGGFLGVGEGEVTLAQLLPGGRSTLRVYVKAPGGASDSYVVGVQVGCSDCNDDIECTTDACDQALELCTHSPLHYGTACDFGGLPGACIDGECTSVCSAVDCADDRNECTVNTCHPIVGCYTPVANGTPCTGGTCGGGACQLSGTALPCTEQAIRNAIAAGGGPYTFDCAGPTTLVTEATIYIDNDVILDGEGRLTVDGSSRVWGAVFWLGIQGVTAELRGLNVVGGTGTNGGGIGNRGALTLTDSTVSGNTASSGGGIWNVGTLTVARTTVSGNTAGVGGGITNGGELLVTDSIVSSNTASGQAGGIWNGGTLALVNSTVSTNTPSGIGIGYGTAVVTTSTVSGNIGAGIVLPPEYGGTATLTNSTVSGHTTFGIYNGGTVTVANSTISGSGIYAIYALGDTGTAAGVDIAATLVDGDCAQAGDVAWTSNGYNVESPGDTCFLNQATDQWNVAPAQLNLGSMQDNGGPTQTHALGPGSFAIDQIPAMACVLTTDQRGVTRPQGAACDVGAFELEQ